LINFLFRGCRPYLFLDETGGKITYKYGKNRKENIDYLEFIARVTSHVPDKGQVMVRYFGLYSNAHRGKMRTRGTVCPIKGLGRDDP